VERQKLEKQLGSIADLNRFALSYLLLFDILKEKIALLKHGN